MKTAVIAGYSGLIGQQLLTLLLEDTSYQKVIALGRRPIDINNPKLIQQVVDFNNIELAIEPVDDVFCCLGTTMKKAGSKEAFRLVDFQFPINLAEVCLKKGARQFALVSSMGADPNSNIFYNQVKGEVENAISKLGFSKIDIYRPSLLLGKRNESRMAEDTGKLFMKALGFLFVGPLKNYKAIDSKKVANAIHHFSKEESRGKHIHLSGELQKY
jgi:uncharacterized protein YbjT (DUF2867 family)